MKIQSFTDLEAWKIGHTLVLNVYRLTKSFPHEEQFGLTSQMRRAAVSVTSNIAEGFSRRSAKEKIQFYHMALGSLTELQNQLLVAKDLHYLSDTLFAQIAGNLVRVNKLIHGLIKTAK
ncbi:hypothetical protein A2165_03845 [Candidatus Curtissbacteria bacterium RBG_13_40_7]|uniref:Four helix bundle protein n=1 Tax=Candidatus Curtissbacteria bacterium RBG_13_40_7 TaxID=1797706 RepID=A0A1F5FTU4_9BACT|nr:MAG: hypothetical protein A2165_03845 [Candidatus Curtissbacteria bacterium RBG_13_40_7]